MLRVADIVFWIATVAWVALAGAGGVAAAAIFPRARELELALAGYEAFLTAHPEEGRMLIAGFFAERVFLLTETPRLACASVAAAALVAQIRLAPTAPLRMTRVAALAIAASALLLGSFWATPDFRRLDGTYRELARTPGQVDAAIAAKPALDAAHGRASNIMTAEVLALLGLVGISAFAAGGARTRA